MQTHLDKLARFYKWAGMDLNVSKCAHTWMNETNNFRPLKWNGTAIPVLLPTETYKYLGVYTSLKLNEERQASEPDKKIDERLENILQSPAAGQDVYNLVRNTIYPLVEHTLNVTLLHPDTVQAIENKLLDFCKKSQGVTSKCLREFLLTPKDKLGLGLTSLVERYHTLTITTALAV